jgi:predicted TIM-barrel fold metal-dependent hydrolase
MIDVNVHTYYCPFQRFPFPDLKALSDHLSDEGIDEAYVSHLGCVFYADPDVFNRELLAACARLDSINAVPIVNPHLNGWRQNLEAYLDAGIRAVKIIPSFHNYRIYSRPVFELIEALDEAGCRLMIQMRYEDERERYFALNVYGPKTDQVVRLALRYPDVPMLCLNAYLTEAKEFGRLTPNLLVDMAFSEWLFTLDLMLEQLESDRILFGSHSPFLITKATALKLTESRLDRTLKKQIGTGNALHFLGG